MTEVLNVRFSDLPSVATVVAKGQKKKRRITSVVPMGPGTVPVDMPPAIEKGGNKVLTVKFLLVGSVGKLTHLHASMNPGKPDFGHFPILSWVVKNN
jgi:hypothetical protein